MLSLRALLWANRHPTWRWLQFVVLYVVQALVMWWAYPRQVPERQWFGQHRLGAALFMMPIVVLVATCVVGAAWLIGRRLDRARKDG
jgi:hypothetical protein